MAVRTRNVLLLLPACCQYSSQRAMLCLLPQYIMLSYCPVSNQVLLDMYKEFLSKTTSRSPSPLSCANLCHHDDSMDSDACASDTGGQNAACHIGNGETGDIARVATPTAVAGDVTPLMSCGQVTPTSTPIYGRGNLSKHKKADELLLVKL